MSYALKLKKVLAAVLMVAAVGAVGVESAKAEGVATANLGVNMSFNSTIGILETYPLTFRLVRDASKNGHYTSFGVLGSFNYDAPAARNNFYNYLGIPGMDSGDLVISVAQDTHIQVTMSPVSLTDGAGHTATLHLLTFVIPLGAPSDRISQHNDSAPFSVDVLGSDVTSFFDGTPTGSIGSQIALYFFPASLDFAAGSDVLGNWTGTASVTFDYTD